MRLALTLRILTKALQLGLLLLFLGACGQKGDLYLPDEPRKAGASSLTEP
ncbi:MAG: LPS translocon maturation chaperone LptM [Gammaproteobacteria bacterium]